MTQSTETMPHQPQNIYDDPKFFQCYKKLRDTESGLNQAIEIPAMRSLLPGLDGLDILDLGCGFGTFARYAVQHGASSVTGVEISQRMLSVAREQTSEDRVTYCRASMESYAMQPAGYDLVVSSLALHYVRDFSQLCGNVASGLKKGGHFIFSVEHPVCTARPEGWVKNEEETFWPVDRYQEEGIRHTRWFVEDVVKYHRTTQTYVNSVIQTGLSLQALLEPQADPAVLAERPRLREHARRPPFLLLKARKI